MVSNPALALGATPKHDLLTALRKEEATMLRGLSTVSFFAADLEAATAWSTELLGSGPYFVRPEDGPPAYSEFRIGDYQHELGIIDQRYAPHALTGGPSGAVIFWHVDDVTAAVERLLALGATMNEEITEREAGFVTASVVDPFGNILGVMYNPHYLEILGSGAK
jgi:predicted enzyme related to lactoylglutathione lyase